MLNISPNNIGNSLDLSQFRAFSILSTKKVSRLPLYFALVGIVILFICLFLPWTQTIKAKGYVTTLSPEGRPQTIQSGISGKLENWYVKEGDFVQKGDTIVFLSEIKSEYLDPSLIDRTSQQVDAKSLSVEAYQAKVNALENQYQSLVKAKQAKLRQTRNKINIERGNLSVYNKNYKIAQNQFSRTESLYNQGLKTLSDLQEKQVKVQESLNKIQVQQNKVDNYVLQLSTVEQEYAEKMAKSLSEKSSAMSAKLQAQGEVLKLENSKSNYQGRQSMYYVKASQSGYITKTLKKGLGEIIKEGTGIVTIMPEKYDLGIEVYVAPQDLPLIKIGEGARIQFDGWPAIVISGWPESSTGIFSGEVVAIDQFVSDNGYYRMLIAPDNSEKKWPEELRVGAGANVFAVLHRVPLWYEIWRQLNGFPPDYYDEKQKKQEVKRKAPLKSVK